MRKRKYHQLSKAERSEIEILRSKGYLQKDIARALGRNKSTISGCTSGVNLGERLLEAL